jgi:anhydro-N-acetylmuramic acid kinase
VIVVAVASGTSADGLDVGIVDLRAAGAGTLDLTVLDTWTDPWPDGLAERLLGVLPPARTTAAELCALDTAVGRAIGAAAATAVARAPVRPTLVVSPGQTVHHEVVGDRCLGTLQLGQPAWVAEATGLPVVSDLRARDVAAGGHGAPLAGILDGLWLAGGPGPRVALNLGGVANVSVVAPDGGTSAWDTGPANCLLDVAAGRATGGRQRFDRDGRLATAGTVRPDLLGRLLDHPYFAQRPPKSTGRETFSADHLDRVLAETGTGAWPDVLATLVELTAVTVADAVLPHHPVEVVASGGGTANPALMVALARRLGRVPVVLSTDHGLPVDGKEVVLWALLGYLTWHGVPLTTGAHPARLLGRVSPGAGPLALPAPLAAPERVEVRQPLTDEERTTTR